MSYLELAQYSLGVIVVAYVAAALFTLAFYR